MTSQATYTSSGFSSLASADLNGDGLLDLVAGYVPPPTGYVPPTSNDFVVFLSQADGGLSPPVSYALSGSFGGAVAIGDLNGDGQPDVAVSYADFVGIFLNDGKGTLTEGAKLGARNGLVVGIAIGDINADGFVDLIATEFSSGLGLTSAEVFYGQGHGIFAAAVALPGVGGTLLGNPVIGDLNLDGLPDIAAASSGDYANLHLVVLLSQGDGGFQSTAYETPLLGQLILLPRAAGAPDLAIANPNVPLGDGGFPESPGTIRLLVNSGDGRFSIGPSYPVPGGEFLTLGDFNGDCIPDIATSACGATAFGSGLSVLYGDTDGGFEAPVSLQTPAEICPAGLAVLGAVESPRALASADLGAGGVTVYGNASRQ